MKKIIALVLVCVLLVAGAVPVSAYCNLSDYFSESYMSELAERVETLLSNNDVPENYLYVAVGVSINKNHLRSINFIYSQAPMINQGDKVYYITYDSLLNKYITRYEICRGFSYWPRSLTDMFGYLLLERDSGANDLGIYLKDVSTAEFYNLAELEEARGSISDTSQHLSGYLYGAPNTSINTSELESLIDQAESLNSDNYTTDTWNDLENILNEAKGLLSSESYTQEEIDTMCDRLQEALDNLVRVSTPSGPWINDDDSRIIYSNGWTYQDDAAFYDGDKHFTNTNGAYAEMTFTGSSIAWIGAKNNKQGRAEVYIDGVLDQTVNLYSSTTETQVEIYRNDSLSQGTHTIRIVNAGSSYINIDAFAVEEGETPPGTEHTVTVVTRYQDGALPEERKTYTVQDGGRFEQSYDVLDGYGVDSGRLRSAFMWRIDQANQLVVIDPVTQDYTVEIVFYKLPETVETHTVRVVKRFDDGTEDSTQTYSVESGMEFNETFDIPAGYTFLNFQADTADAYFVRSENRVVIDTVNQDSEIILEFTKA